MIKTFKEMIHEQIEAGAKTAADKYWDAVRPIYGVDRNGKPCHIGSSFLLEYKALRYVITAAHVIDNWKETTLYVGGSKELVVVEAEFYMTVAPKGDRENDHYDFAWAQISEAFYNALGAVSLIQEADVAPTLPNLKGRVYMGLGYPRSKNKKANPKTKKLRPKRARYYANWKAMEAMYSELGVSGREHIAIGRKMQSRDSDGQMVNSIGPRGMSGGPLIDLGNMVSIDELATGVTHPGRLAGVLIEHDDKHDAILSVRIEHILNAINQASNAKEA